MSLKPLLFLIFLATILSYSKSTNELLGLEVNDDALEEEAIVPKVRTKRGIFWDFFQKLVITKNLIVDQYVDTKNTLNEAYNLLNDGFSDPAPRKPTLPSTSTPKSSSAEDEDKSAENATTTEKYSISRYEFGRILGRNFRGLQRLTKIELQDAFNQSHYNIQGYRAEARKQFANSIAVEKKKKLESFAKG